MLSKSFHLIGHVCIVVSSTDSKVVACASVSCCFPSTFKLIENYLDVLSTKESTWTFNLEFVVDAIN